MGDPSERPSPNHLQPRPDRIIGHAKPAQIGKLVIWTFSALKRPIPSVRAR